MTRTDAMRALTIRQKGLTAAMMDGAGNFLKPFLSMR